MSPEQITKEAVENKLKKNNRLMVILLVVVLLTAAGGGFFFVTNGRHPDMATAAARAKVKVEKFNLESVVVNLSDPGLRRYLRTQITLEYTEPRLEAELEGKTYRIRDTVISVLRNKMTEELQTEEVLKQELTAAINAQLHSGQIEGLYFEEFLIQ